MEIPGAARIGELLEEYFAGEVEAWKAGLAARPTLLPQLEVYLQLLARWNERTNLSAIRQPEEMVQRHFGESLLLAMRLEGKGTALDLGSGAGFPGLPVQLWWPDLRVTLAESQGKKSTFLREVSRTLGLGTEVWSGRAETLVGKRTFGAVTMRAVDEPYKALRAASALSSGAVWVLGAEETLRIAPGGMVLRSRVGVPGRQGSFLFELGREMFHVEQS